MLPFLAQGGAMAIEDAAVLAATLARTTRRSGARACGAYERARAKRAPRKVQRAARKQGRIYGLTRARSVWCAIW